MCSYAWLYARLYVCLLLFQVDIYTKHGEAEHPVWAGTMETKIHATFRFTKGHQKNHPNSVRIY